MVEKANPIIVNNSGFQKSTPGKNNFEQCIPQKETAFPISIIKTNNFRFVRCPRKHQIISQVNLLLEFVHISIITSEASKIQLLTNISR